MARAIDPSMLKDDGYVVPLPRVTDTIGRSLRHAFGPPPPADFVELLRRLDSIH